MTSSNGNIFHITDHLCGESPVPGEFPAQSQQREALMFSLIGAWINGSENNREAGDVRRYRAHHHVTAMAHFEIHPIQIKKLKSRVYL